MMLHSHFETEKPKNMTTLADLNESGKPEEFVSEIFPPNEEAKPKRGRPRKNKE